MPIMNRKRWIQASLLVLILLMIFSGYQFMRYLVNQDSTANQYSLDGLSNGSYQPKFLYSIDGIDGPFAVAATMNGESIYVTESLGERLVKVFSREGTLLTSFVPPGTTNTNRILTYIAISPDGWVFVTDQYNAVIHIFKPDGEFIDAIISKDMTLSKWIKINSGSNPKQGDLFYYDRLSDLVIHQDSSGSSFSFPGPSRMDWNPLGLRFDQEGNLLVTNLVAGLHQVLVIPQESLQDDLSNYQPKWIEFGSQGDQAGQFSFPNAAVRDNQGNYYISDGNNGRISTWSSDQVYLNFFGYGSVEYLLNLPRGVWMDDENRLFVVDTVGQMVKVFTVSGDHSQFLFNMGGFGQQDGRFNFPTDMCMDASGTIYITDTGNNRVSIWR